MRENRSSGFMTRSDINDQYSLVKRLEACNFKFKKRDCAIQEAKTKALISCAITAQPVCDFVFTLVKIRFCVTRLICGIQSAHQLPG